MHSSPTAACARRRWLRDQWGSRLCGKHPMSKEYLNNSKRWYDRAAEMRVLSDEMRDDEARRMMLKLAEDYDTLGDRAMDRLKHQKDISAK